MNGPVIEDSLSQIIENTEFLVLSMIQELDGKYEGLKDIYKDENRNFRFYFNILNQLLNFFPIKKYEMCSQ